MRRSPDRPSAPRRLPRRPGGPCGHAAAAARTGARRARLHVDGGGQARRSARRAPAPSSSMAPARRRQPRPVVVFLHSWGAVNPGALRRLDRASRPQGQSRPLPALPGREPLASGGCLGARRETSSKTRSQPWPTIRDAKPDLERVAYHRPSRPACRSRSTSRPAPETDELPAPKLVFGLMPGGIASNEKERGILLQDLSTIAPDDPAHHHERRPRPPAERPRRPPDPAARRAPFRRTASSSCAPAPDDHGFPAHDRDAGLARLAEGRIRRHRHQAAARSAARSEAAQHLALERRHVAHRASRPS